METGGIITPGGRPKGNRPLTLTSRESPNQQAIRTWNRQEGIGNTQTHETIIAGSVRTKPLFFLSAQADSRPQAPREDFNPHEEIGQRTSSRVLSS